MNYMLFWSVVSYGIILWGEAYEPIFYIVQYSTKFTKKFLKFIISKANNLALPLTILKLLELETRNK